MMLVVVLCLSKQGSGACLPAGATYSLVATASCKVLELNSSLLEQTPCEKKGH